MKRDGSASTSSDRTLPLRLGPGGAPRADIRPLFEPDERTSDRLLQLRDPLREILQRGHRIADRRGGPDDFEDVLFLGILERLLVDDDLLVHELLVHEKLV